MVATPNRTLVIDADAHVIETEHTWDFLEPGEEKYRPISLSSTEDASQRFWLINGQIRPHRFALSEKQQAAASQQTGRLITYSPGARDLDDVGLRLKGLDELGVDIQVLHNTMWLAPVSDVPEIERALCRSWNRWLADIHRQGENRLYWTCIVPAFDLECAVEEMRFARAHGAVALSLRPYERDFIVSDPHFYPLFEEAVRLDMAIAVHLGNGNSELGRMLKSRYSTFSDWGHRVATVNAAMSVLSSRVIEEFPSLRWGIIEASASWVPWLCHEFRRRTGEPFGPDSNPFLNRNVYVTAEFDDDIAYITKAVGEKVLLIGTDFGHTDTASEYDALMKLRDSEAISDSVKRGMLSENPASLYGLTDRVSQGASLADHDR